MIPRARTGRPRAEHRRIINGMVYKTRAGISWRDLPERYGPWKTVYTRFRRYALDGVFTRALQQVQAQADADRRGSTGTSTAGATSSSAASTGSKVSMASRPPGMTRPPPPNEAAVCLASFLLWQDPFEDGP
ncbi:transposase [Streptomyces sp. NBC_01180]|uniref:transposase n=1 Tax=Streptomyces sp. NBC_01180 TaxID=2903763 RepID=UPI003869D142